MTTVLLCIVLGSCPPARGGHAESVGPPRGGQAVEVVIVRDLERFDSWVCIHGREAAWNRNNGNGYHGGLQMDRGFMLAYGRDALARHHGQEAEAWTPAEQIVVAERGYRSGRGFQPWPNTARRCGLPMGRVNPEPWLPLPEEVPA